MQLHHAASCAVVSGMVVLDLDKASTSQLEIYSTGIRDGKVNLAHSGVRSPVSYQSSQRRRPSALSTEHMSL